MPGYNHYASCPCGWCTGGGGGRSGRSGRSFFSSFINEFEQAKQRQQKEQEAERSRRERDTFRIPSLEDEEADPLTFLTICPFGCGAQVWYHTNGYGDSVYFDRLGKPWEIHSCFADYWEDKKNHPKILGNLQHRFHHMSSSLDNDRRAKRILLGVIKKISKTKRLSEYVLYREMGLSVTELRYYFGRFYKPTSYDENEWASILRKLLRSIRGKDIRLTIHIDFYLAINGGTCPIPVKTGKNQSFRNETFTVPPGMKDGTKFSFSEKGEPGRGHIKNGDLYITCKVEQEKDGLKRSNNDIYSTVELPARIARKGGIMKVQTVLGQVSIKISPSSKPKEIVKLEGYGVPINNDLSNRGHHFIELVFGSFQNDLERLKDKLEGNNC